MNIAELVAAGLKDTKLEILIFGPAVTPTSADALTASLQEKRRQIKETLVSDGHSARFGEDVVDPSLSGVLSDPLTQEIVAMRAADLILVLVLSPGSIAEATVISTQRDLCGKAVFYCLDDHQHGLVARRLQAVTAFGATHYLMSRNDIAECHLLAAIHEKVKDIRIGKAFLF